MKKFIQWLAKVFNANITTEKVVTGKIEATGGITCYKEGGNYEHK